MTSAPSTAEHWTEGLADVAAVRIARPTGRLDDLRRFYLGGLGLRLIGSFEDHAGFSGILVGLPGLAYHLEFTQTANAPLDEGVAPTDDNNLVLYFRDSTAVSQVAQKLTAMGYALVRPPNPYWDDRAAITIADPDGWRVVLMPHSFEL